MTASKKTDKTRHSKRMKENASNKSLKITRRHTNNLMQRKQNNFGVKFGYGRNITGNPNE